MFVDGDGGRIEALVAQRAFYLRAILLQVVVVEAIQRGRLVETARAFLFNYINNLVIKTRII